MKASNGRLFLAGLALLVLASSIPRRIPDGLSGCLQPRPFLRLAGFELVLWGVDFAKLDRELSSTLLVPSKLRDAGGRLKLALGQTRDWLFLARSMRRPEATQIVLREEVIDEFESQLLDANYAANVHELIEFGRAFKRASGTLPDILIAPTKIVANDIDVRVGDAELDARRVFRVDGSGRRVGAEGRQRRVERDFAREGFHVHSVLDAIAARRTDPSEYPPYPYGESHWSRRLVLALGDVLARAVVVAHGLPNSCLRAIPWPEELRQAKPVELEGDLTRAFLAGTDSSFAGTPRDLQMPPFRDRVSPPDADSTCPPIIFAGTSYGKIYEREGTIVDAMQAFYRGPITNASIAGEGRWAAMRSLQKKSLPKGAIVIWEFPFRYVKQFR